MDRRRFMKSSAATAVAASLPINRSWAAIMSGAGNVETDLNAITGDGAEITLQQAAVQELGDALRGNLLLPGHDAYELARKVRNPSISKFPALIVQPKGVADVKDAVDFARESDLLVSIKCGGHSFSGKSTCDGGMMIDLSHLRSTRVDPDRRIAHVSGGSWLADMDHDTMKFGLVTTAGTVSHTGVGGLTLGGGFGRVARKHGLAIDNLRSVELVTADGRFVRASAQENSELFWGIRGGGGNFGVVTDFEFQLHPMDRTVIGGDIGFPMEQARDILKFYADYLADKPDEFYSHGGLLSIPGGFSGVYVHVCYTGDPAKADKLIEPLRKAGTPVFDTIGPKDYVAIQKSGDSSESRVLSSYIKSGFLAEISPDLIDTLLEGFEARPDRGLFAMVAQSGGAINRVASDATAFAHRSAMCDMFLSIQWEQGLDATQHIKEFKEYFSTVAPYTSGFYFNDSMDDSAARINRNYQGNYERLVALKNEYDPTNLFRLNANIKPTV